MYLEFCGSRRRTVVSMNSCHHPVCTSSKYLISMGKYVIILLEPLQNDVDRIDEWVLKFGLS